MDLRGNMRPSVDTTDGLDHTKMMSESSALARISAYVAKSKLIVTLESKSQGMMVVKATEFEVNKEISLNGQDTTSKSHRLDCIYDDKPLGFEKDPLTSTKRTKAQDPLEEIDLAYVSTKRPTCIIYKLEPTLKIRVIEMLKEFRDYFTWDQYEMSRLIWELVELKQPIKHDKRHVKQTPRRFAPEVMSKIKA